MKEFEHLEIKQEDIKLATNKFYEKNVIENDGFDKAYKGEMPHSTSCCNKATIPRLAP